MGTHVLGLKIVADVSSLTRGAHKAMRSFSTVEYLGDKMGNKFKGKDGIFGEKAMHGLGLAGGTSLMAGMGLAVSGAAVANIFTKPMLTAANKAETAMKNAMFLASADSVPGLEKRITDTVRKVATSSTISISEGYETIGSIIQSGIDASIAPDLLASVVEYSEASFGKTDVAGAVALLTTGLQKFNVEGTTAGEKMRNLGDILTATKKHTAFDDKSIKSYFQALGAAPKLNTTTSTQEWMVLGGMLKGTGKTARRVGQNMNSLTAGTIKFQTALANIKNQNQGQQTRDAAADMGIDFKSFTDKEGKMKSMIDIIGIITEGAKTAAKKDGRKAQDVMESVYTKLFGGIKVTPEIVKLFNEMIVLSSEKTFKGFDAFSKKLEAVKNASGEMNKAAEINRATWVGMGKVIEGIIESINTMIGQEMKDMLSGALVKVKNTFEKISAALLENKSLRQAIAYFALLAPVILGAVGTLLSLFGLFSILAPSVGGLLSLVGAAITGLSGAFVPVMLVIAGLAAAGAVLFHIFNNNVGGAATWLAKKFEIIKMTIKGIIEFWNGWGDTKVANQLRELGIWELVKSLYMLKERIKAMWTGFRKAYEASGIGELFEELSKKIQQTFDKIFAGNGKFARSDMRRWEQYGSQLFQVFKWMAMGVYLVVYAIHIAIMAIDMFAAAVKFAWKFINDYAIAFQILATWLTVVLVGLVAFFAILGIAIGIILAGLGFVVLIVTILLSLLIMLVVGLVYIGIAIGTMIYENFIRVRDVVIEILDYISQMMTPFEGGIDVAAKSFLQRVGFIDEDPGEKSWSGAMTPQPLSESFATQGPLPPRAQEEAAVNRTDVGGVQVTVLGDVSEEGARSLGEGIGSGLGKNSSEESGQSFWDGG